MPKHSASPHMPPGAVAAVGKLLSPRCQAAQMEEPLQLIARRSRSTSEADWRAPVRPGVEERRLARAADSERGANGPSSKTEIWRAPEKLLRACASSVRARASDSPAAAARGQKRQRAQPRPPGEGNSGPTLLPTSPLQIGYGTP